MLCHGDLSSAQLFLSLLFPSLIVLVSLDSGAHFLQLRVVVARVMEAHAPGSLLVLRVSSEPFSLTFSPFLLSVIVLVSLDSGAHFLQLRVVVARMMELELELIQTQMAQKPMLRAEVGMRVRCANKASAE